MPQPIDMNSQEGVELKCLFDLQGFVILPGVLTRDECGRMLDAVRRLETNRADELAKHDQIRLDGLPQIDPIFDIPVAHPRLMPLLREFLVEPQLVNTWAISKGPRADISRWHRGLPSGDYSCRNGVIRTHMLNTAWLLTDNNPGNGGLGVLPASHKNNIDLAWPNYRGLSLPGSIEVCGRAGDVVVFSECLIHEGLPKRTPGLRTNLYYNHVDLNLVGGVLNEPQNLDVFRFPPSVRGRFNAEQRSITRWMDYVSAASNKAC